MRRIESFGAKTEDYLALDARGEGVTRRGEARERREEGKQDAGGTGGGGGAVKGQQQPREQAAAAAAGGVGGGGGRGGVGGEWGGRMAQGVSEEAMLKSSKAMYGWGSKRDDDERLRPHTLIA